MIDRWAIVNAACSERVDFDQEVDFPSVTTMPLRRSPGDDDHTYGFERVVVQRSETTRDFAVVAVIGRR